ncbi:porin family protein [Patescibacteria group bacterium]|nr:porin family protein [Patescibacteria group bacterium]
MKKLVITTALILMMALPSHAIDKTGLFGIGLNGALSIPASGDLTSDSSLSDYVDVGPRFGVFVNYTPASELTLQAGFNYGFMKIKDDANPSATEEPYLVTPEIYLTGKLNLGSFIKSETTFLNPYLSAGPSLVMWKFTADGAGGDPILIGDEEFKKSSLGLNFGAGIESMIARNMAVFFEGRYLMIFSEDEEKFGVDFGNMSTIDVNVGLTYYLPFSSK